MEKYFYILLSFSISVLLSMVVTPKILLISALKKLYDIPDARKVHHKAISRLGGTAFLPIICLTIALVTAIHNILNGGSGNYFDITQFTNLCVISCGLIILFLIGVTDDLIGVRYKTKFVTQILSGGLLVASGIYFDNLYGLFGIYAIPPVIGMPLTVFFVVYIINAINLIDGVDGLCSGLCGIALIGFGIHFAMHNLWMYVLVVVVTLGTLVPFFYFNVFGNSKRGRKIFMGDTGSLTLGFILSVLTVRCSMYDNISLMNNNIGFSFSFLLIPLLDVIRVFLHRIRTKAHPFKPDRNHIHHKFLDLGLSSRQTMAIIVIIAVVFVAVNGICLSNNKVNINLVLAIDLSLYVGLNAWLTHRIKERQSEKIIITKQVKL
ncbi:MAG: MraY family glycosyltransferase [Dysgonomonas sp.]